MSMAIQVSCDCGRTLSLKNELAGEKIRCPDCGGTIDVPVIAAQADAIFDRDRFLLRQRMMSISQIYDVRDDRDQSVLFVKRPTALGWMILGILAGLLVFFSMFLGGLVLLQILKIDGGGQNVDRDLVAVLVLGLTLLSMLATLATVVAIIPRRHVFFYRDQGQKDSVLEIHQDRKLMPFRPHYTLVCPQQGPIAKFSKNIVYSLFRKRWWCHDLEGHAICTAYEDSIILSLLRRLFGPAFGLLRTNYVIVRGSSADGDRLGEFNRKLTLFDRYVLDLSADPTRSLDRRIALAMGVLLDTGDGR
jgi:hypothetical protein